MNEKYKKIQEKLDKFKQEVVFKDNLEHKELSNIIKTCVERSTPTIYKGTKKEQCYYSGMRSAGDMYRIAKSYIKDITYEDVINALEELYRHKLVHHSFCNVVNKRVHSSGYHYSYSTDKIKKCLNNAKLNKS